MKMGRRPKLTDHKKRDAIKRRDHGDETLAEIGRSYNVSGWTVEVGAVSICAHGALVSKQPRPREFDLLASIEFTTVFNVAWATKVLLKAFFDEPVGDSSPVELCHPYKFSLR